MKKFKKVFAVLLTLAMVMGLCMTTAAADTVVGNSDDEGTITVSGITDKDVTVKAYPIVKATYDANGSFSGYANPYNIADITAPEEDELAAIAQKFYSEGAIPPEPVVLNGPDSSGNYTNNAVGNSDAKEMKVGMYLIVVEGAETSVYNPAVASIYYKNEDGNYSIEPGSLTMGTTIEGTNTWVKKSGQPDVDKTVRDTALDKDGNATNDATENGDVVTGNKGNTANIGDQVTYDVTINPIPNYGGNYPKLNIKDTLSDGLTYVEDSIKVFIVANGSTTIGDKLTGASQEEYDVMDDTEKADVDYIYAASASSKEITVNFVVDGNYTLNSYAGGKALIEYRATVNDQAALNSNGNKNGVILEYSRNSTTNEGETTPEKETHTYTFDIDGTVVGIDKSTTTQNIINKLGDITDTEVVEGKKVRKPLQGAKFGLFTDAGATVVYKNGDTAKKSWDNIVTDENGQTPMKGLEAGTYYLKELSAPDGYSVNTHIFKIEIKAEIDTTSGLLTSWKVIVDGNEENPAASFAIDNVNNTVTKTLLPATQETGNRDGYNILNTKLSSLPSTGGIGTTIFTIGGCAIMIIAAALFFASRRKSTK